MPTRNDVEADLLQYAFEVFAAADEALRDEVREVRSTERRDAAVVHDGRRDASSTHGHGTRYVFQTTAPVRVSVGERVQSFVEGVPPLRATVAECSPAALVLDVEADPGTVARVVSDGYAADLDEDEIDNLGRDPFVVCHALTDPAARCVVTTERPRPSRVRANRHLPDVCATFGVATCHPFEFTRRLGFTTRWQAAS